MKLATFAACTAFSFLALSAAQPAHADEAAAGIESEPLKVRTTAYTATEHNGGGFVAASGRRLTTDGPICSAASDWSWLPLGTVFRLPATGRTYRIDDYGSALVGRKTIDLYMRSAAQMRRWGVRHAEIEIVSVGSFEASLHTLEARQKSRHVRRMVAALRRRTASVSLVALNAAD